MLSSRISTTATISTKERSVDEARRGPFIGMTTAGRAPTLYHSYKNTI